MDQAIAFDKVTSAELPREVSYCAAAGSIAAVVSSRQEQNDEQVRLALGLMRPSSGRLRVLGVDPAAASEQALAALRREVAVLFPAGGLVANLKVWENLVLPLEYHGRYQQGELEEKGRGALARVGYSGALMESPSRLSLYQKRQIGLARVMLCQPRLIVYNAVLSGLNDGERDALVAAALAFHEEQPGRTSLFLTPTEEIVKEIPVQQLIVIGEEPS